MKNLLLICAIVAGLSLTSCSKEYTCTCTVESSGITTTSTSTIEGSKSDARDACEAGSGTVTNAGITVTTTCSIE